MVIIVMLKNDRIPTPGPTEPPGCAADDECGSTEICRNRQCLDPCAILNPCAPNAECQVGAIGFFIHVFLAINLFLCIYYYHDGLLI